MAFWGVKVKRDRPFVHSPLNASGRLKITQATLGRSFATGKIRLQCSVGERNRISLCVLLPDQVESCPLDLEFEEPHTVTFSVLGCGSVHLSGYYLCDNLHASDIDSHGIDIENSTGSEEKSDLHGEDNKYDLNDSFIDDSEQPDAAPSRSVLQIKEFGETSVRKERLKGRKGNGRKLMKQGDFICSDDNDAHEPEIKAENPLLNDEEPKRDMKLTSDGDTNEKNDVPQGLETIEQNDDGNIHENKEESDTHKHKNNVEDLDLMPPLDHLETKLAFDGETNEKNEVPNVVEITEQKDDGNITENKEENVTLKHTNNVEDLDLMPPLDHLAKPKEKRKKLSKEDEEEEISKEKKQQEAQASKNMELGIGSEFGSGTSQKSKKRKKERKLSKSKESIQGLSTGD